MTLNHVVLGKRLATSLLKLDMRAAPPPAALSSRQALPSSCLVIPSAAAQALLLHTHSSRHDDDDRGGTENGGVRSAKRSKFAKYFRVLQLDIKEEELTREILRRQYISMVKKYHPDTAVASSGKDHSGNGDDEDIRMQKFLEIDEAFKILQQKLIDDRRTSKETEGEFGLFYEEKEEEETNAYNHPDIEHTAPQHRQYLSNEGLGAGTPGQRQRQYQKYRAMRAAENVYEHRVGKLTAQYETRLVAEDQKSNKNSSGTGKTKKRPVTTKNAIERLVEDLISESMARGEFDNLKGSGKPLPERVVYNPYQDFTTHKMNEILVEGGFAPEWITLQRDIKLAQQTLRQDMAKKCRAIVVRCRQRDVITRGSDDVTVFDWQKEAEREWKKFSDEVLFNDDEVKRLNKSIDKFNLMVPMLNGQMFHFNVVRESKRIFQSVLTDLDQQNIGDDEGDTSSSSEQIQKTASRSDSKKPCGDVHHNSADADKSVWSYIRNEFKTYFNRNKSTPTAHGS